ncbi:SDR family NAD(P)-dependent oxidoreductase [Pseudooceanicola sp. CBS1P-1]|uniref:SDR family NAD(P)-dependent oxidoreductase n=1 Tax=Pseudooceanicola albus TaxID=2692189 RepID=A0A6L7G7G9_9RHOB|nr:MULTISPECIES: SDR family NAD(P)-dependent oxidoreductase [Pseudooceanicola]MBT9385967.1 SDR family NAD(P)-dependent oxidoreductase [Pseudooceanicola endophyticus]MXN19612.1 SDR family NAD(P)-dependent oxidoreductase [Pseudooceanicola albus]
MTHPALQPGALAVITGAASGIGLAAARAFAGAGMRPVLIDLPGPALEEAARALDAVAIGADVSDRGQMTAARDQVAALGPVSVLMSNAGVEGGGALFADPEVWRRTLEVNLGGAVNCVQLFLPQMIAGDTPGAVIFTGSKQGITLPPGDTAYNVSKAALKALAESTAHELVQATGSRISAHLLVPGFTYTGFTRAKGVTEQPEGAWSPEQVVAELTGAMDAGRFYVICPDNEVDRATDTKRMVWAMGDLTEGRPPLSRWHPDWAGAFAAYMDEG